MGETNSKRGMIGSAVTAVIVIALIILGIVFSEFKLSEVQAATMKTLLIVCSCAVLYCFITGEITKNYSQMDKLWSILPVAYVWIIAANGGMKARLVIYALIVTAWGIRLTVNFARKGAYSIKFWTGVEDYRWSIVELCAEIGDVLQPFFIGQHFCPPLAVSRHFGLDERDEFVEMLCCILG